jgi:hypothetical protein
MKSLLGKVGVILIGLLIFVIGCQKTVLRNESTKGADWKLYNSDEECLGYYDAQSITRPSKNIVRFWTKSVWTEKGVSSWVKDSGKKYENLSHTIYLQEINCAEKKIRRLSVTQYGHKGSVIDIIDSPSFWIFIPPESMMEILYKEVCK